MPFSLQSPLEIDLPLVDFTQFPQDFDAQFNHLEYQAAVAKVREACKEWGFFRLVNHGIPVDLMEKVETVNRELLSLPTEVKDRGANSDAIDSYYRSPNYEAFRFFIDEPNSDSLGKISRDMWPQEGNSNFCETLGTYALRVSNLAQTITKMILASLGLDVKAFYNSDFEKCKSVLRINGYSSRGKSIGEEALVSHADLGCVTILYQDNVGGLQIRSKEGKWFNVKPLSHSFVVNVGDSLKAWSNGRCRSAEHRVVCTGWKDRISIAFFTVFPDDMQISAPAELVDEKNPRRYKPFVYSEFRHEVKTNKEDKEKATAIERFAGV